MTREIMGRIGMSDLISRQAAIDAIYKCTDFFVGNLPVMIDKADAYKALAEIPSAQPEREKGKWLPDTRAFQIKFVCSVCKESLNVDTVNLKPKWNFCPNCGADMRGKRK